MRAFILIALAATSLAATSLAAADDTLFEQVLVPFDTQTITGVNTIWTAELRVRNDGDQPINLFPEKCFFLGREFPCFQRADVPARTTILLDQIKPDYATPAAIFLYVPKARAADVSFNLRVAAAGDPIGTEIPVVRERNYRTGRTTLLNIPLGAGSRPSLRIYSPILLSHVFRVRIYRDPGDVLILERSFELIVPTDPPIPAVVPIMVDASSALADASLQNPGRVRVTIEQSFPQSALPYWPLATITDNATQRIIAITPQ
jgi:hypothetical protein